MESGLEDRNNPTRNTRSVIVIVGVSMESGLEDRNNGVRPASWSCGACGLNGVRPRRPEQCAGADAGCGSGDLVSMESGLEDRNNEAAPERHRPRSRVSMESGLEDRNNRDDRCARSAAGCPSQWSPA